MKQRSSLQLQDHAPRAAAARTFQLWSGVALADRRAGSAVQRARIASLEHSPRMAAQRQQAALLQRAQNRSGMPDNLKVGIEALSGMDMARVRVHLNSDQPAKLHALAFAQGQDIYLAPGQEQHLPHEAWHLVQQREGRVKPTRAVNGTAINDDPALEHEADAMGQRALQRAALQQHAAVSKAGTGRGEPAPRIDPGTPWSKFAGVMHDALSIPTRVAVNMDIKDGHLPMADTDYRGQDPAFVAQHQALTITGFGPGGGGWLTFRHPSRGDFIYTVSYQQLLQMAGDGAIRFCHRDA
jgi:hypothetical protein